MQHRSFSRIAVACGACTVTLATVVSADTIRVDPTSPTNGLGTSWSNAYHLLQDALSDSTLTEGDEIHVAGGWAADPPTVYI
jgi:hypothetical protein